MNDDTDECEEPPNSRLSIQTLDLILKKYGENVDPSKIPDEYQTVLLVDLAHGIIGNGGFQYLFEGNFPGDPEYLLTREAFKRIGATQAVTAFEKAFAVFPKSKPPGNINRRLRYYCSKYAPIDAIKNKNSPEAIYFSSMKETERCLEEFIKTNAAAFAALK